MWVDVIEALLPVLQTDTELTALLGGAHIYRAKSLTSIRTPGIFYTVVSDSVEENTEPVRVFWDIVGGGATLVGKMELRLYQLMHSDMPVEISGLRMWSQYQDAHDGDTDDQGVVRRIVEYLYRPARLNG